MSDTLSDARLQLHWAAQAVAGVGRSLVPPRADDSHSNLEWSHGQRALMSNAIADARRAALRFRDLTLLVLGSDGSISEEFTLRGRSSDEAFAFFERAFGATVRGPNEHEALPMAPPDRFDPSVDDLARLDRLYDDAAAVLEAWRARRHASEVRCWPHHFDIATLQTLPGGRTIGAGFLAGDAEIAEPYWYVTPYPYPENRNAFAPLPRGEWHRQPWFGAVLRGDCSRDDAAAFLDEAARRLTLDGTE